MNNLNLLSTSQTRDKIDTKREYRAKLYFQIINHFKGILDAWWRLQFDEAPPQK